VLSREELVVYPFDNSGRRFGWLRPVTRYCETSLPMTEIVLGEERASLLRGETV
jgi:hypothetical protein